MLRKLKIPVILIMILCVTFLSSGCWDATSVDKRALGILNIEDKINGEFVYYTEVVDMKGGGSGEQSQEGKKSPAIKIVKGTGKTYGEARENLNRQTSLPLFLGAVQATVFTENSAREGISDFIFRVRSLEEIRKSMHILTTPDKPEDILNVSPENAIGVGFALEDEYNTQLNEGHIAEISYEDVLDKLYSKNNSFLLSSIDIESGKIAINGYSVFKDGKDIGFIPVNQWNGIAYLTADLLLKPMFVYNVGFGDRTAEIEVTCTKRNIRAEYKNGRIIFNLDLGFDGSIQYISDSGPLTKQDQRQVRENLIEMLRHDLSDTLDLSQNVYGCDYLSFSEAFRIAYPDIYEKMDWTEEFKKAQFILNIDADTAVEKTQDLNVSREPQ